MEDGASSDHNQKQENHFSSTNEIAHNHSRDYWHDIATLVASRMSPMVEGRAPYIRLGVDYIRKFIVRMANPNQEAEE